VQQHSETNSDLIFTHSFLLLKQAVYAASLTVAYLSFFIESLFENVAYISCGEARNQWSAGGSKRPPENFSPPLEKCIGHRLKLVDIVQKMWAPLRKRFAPPSDPSWLRAWLWVILKSRWFRVF